jgi:hypothetical protein
MQDPIALAVLRLHYEEYGSCAECGPDSNKGWPCPTVRAIEEVAAEPSPVPSEAIAAAFQEALDNGLLDEMRARPNRYAFVIRWPDGREPELATRNGRLVVSVDRATLCPPYDPVVFSGDPAWTVPVTDEPVLEAPLAGGSSVAQRACAEQSTEETS